MQIVVSRFVETGFSVFLSRGLTQSRLNRAINSSGERKLRVYLLVRNTDVPRHYATHRAGVSGRCSRVLQISHRCSLFRERLAPVPVQRFVARIQLVHLSQQIPLLLFQHRNLHLLSRVREGDHSGWIIYYYYSAFG